MYQTAANDSSRRRCDVLLQRVGDLENPLTEAEVGEVARLLDGGIRHQVYRRGTRVPYRSVDLKLGEHTQPPADLGRRAPVEQFDPQTQDEAFQFVRSDVRIERRTKNTHPWISIGGVGRKFYHHQLYAAFWTLRHERGPRRGTIEADLMGLGKTSIAYLYIILNFFLAENAQHVRRYPGSHLRPSRAGVYKQPGDARCPSWRRWPIRCRCEESSVTSEIAARDGASLIFVPKMLLGNWMGEWSKLHLDPALEIRFHVHHGDYIDHAIPSAEFSELELVPDDARQCPQPHGPRRPCLAHRYVVLTTVQSYYSRLAEYNGRDMRPWTTIVSRHSRGHMTDGLAWGRVVLDEAQLCVSADTKTFVILESLSHSGWVPPNFVALTGTPMLRHGVGDMLALIKHINSISPSLDAVDQRFRRSTQVSYLDDLAERYRHHARHYSSAGNHRDSEAPLAREVGSLQTSYCIRRHSATVQNGKMLAYIPPLQRVDLLCSSPPQAKVPVIREVEEMLRGTVTADWLELLEAQNGCDEVELPVNPQTLLDNVLMGRIVATFPSLATYKPRAHLSWKQISLEGWHREPRTSPFYAGMPELEASSGKLQVLREFFARWQNLLTWDDQPEQLVILSEFALVCHIVHCFCLRLGISSYWVHANVNSGERDEIVRAFQSEGRSEKKVRVLIGTSRIMGQGVTLNRAHRLILMEPSHHAGIEDQNADRVHRLGSKTDRCWFYRMVNQDSTLERVLVEHQRGQTRFQNLVEFAESK